MLSISHLIRSLLTDLGDLIRQELALARAELRDEVAVLKPVGVAFGGAAVLALLGAGLLAVALSGAIAYFLHWPSWAGYALVAFLLLGTAYGLVRSGQRRLHEIRTLPKTTETVKENLQWMQRKSA